MWCDNCLLILPLRAGGIAWAVLIATYSIAGSLFLLLRGEYLFFVYPEWQSRHIYGGIGLAVASAAIVSMFALSNRSYIWTRVVTFCWPFIIVISAVRAILIIVELQRGRDKIAWECAHGGQLWPDSISPNVVPSGSLPASFCTTGFSSLNAAFIISLLVDIACQIYMFFLTWRFSKRLEHYSGLKGPFHGGYYNA